MNKNMGIALLVFILIGLGIGGYVILRQPADTPVSTANLVAVDPEQEDGEDVNVNETSDLCPEGQKQGGFFDGSEFYTSCYDLPADYGKTCSNSNDCIENCIVTEAELTGFGCGIYEGALDWIACPRITGHCSETSPLRGILVDDEKVLRITHQ